MKRKILIMTAAALLTLGLATVSAQSPAPAEEVPGEIVYDVVEPQRYEAETPAYTVDANGNITLDVEIHLLGDVDGNGRISINEVNAAYAHVRKAALLSGYDFACCDLDGNGRISINEVNAMYSHVRKATLLW